MSAGEHAARAGMREDTERNRHQVELTDESRRMLQSVLREDMSEAFAEGLKQAMTSENAGLFVRAMFAEAQRMATEKSVEVAGGLLKEVVKKGFLFLLLGSIVYSFGGWGAVAAAMKWLLAQTGKT